MEYLSAKQAAEKWGISDRRVRLLCAAGKIAGVKRLGKAYRIPALAEKPADGRRHSAFGQKYLKWDDAVIGTISAANELHFLAPDYNKVVALYTHGAKSWTAEQVVEFLSERVVSRDRRDIERILFRCGLSQYDVLRIAAITRGIHPKDLLWIANTKDETLASVITAVFDSVFLQRIDLQGDSIDTPEGYNIKRYGVLKGKYGIYKQRINPLVTDVESEIAVYRLAERMGVPCCPAVRADQNTVFSTFLYDYSKEYIVHFRRLVGDARGENEFENLVRVRPQYRDAIISMLLLDFITRQDDRHLSNIAVKVCGSGESFYPLYDNGRSLFYEDTEETVQRAVKDVAGYSTTFGPTGSYFDQLLALAKEGVDLTSRIDLSVSPAETEAILAEAGFTGYRLEGAVQWIAGAIALIRSL